MSCWNVLPAIPQQLDGPADALRDRGRLHYVVVVAAATEAAAHARHVHRDLAGIELKGAGNQHDAQPWEPGVGAQISTLPSGLAHAVQFIGSSVACARKG